MQQSFRKSSQTAFHTHPNYRVVKVSNRHGEVGMLLPHANLVVPDKHAIRRLGDIIALYRKLPVQQFNYGSTSSYDKSPQSAVQRVEPVELNSIKGLPLFGKLASV